MKSNIERVPEAKIGVVDCVPFVTAEQFNLQTMSVDAVIILTYATGTVPAVLDDAIRQKTESDVPVFLVSKNPGDKQGIKNPRKYESQVQTLEAGAIPLQTVNINNMNEIGQAIKKEFAAGKRGAELGQIIKDQFSLPAGVKANKTK